MHQGRSDFLTSGSLYAGHRVGRGEFIVAILVVIAILILIKDIRRMSSDPIFDDLVVLGEDIIIFSGIAQIYSYPDSLVHIIDDLVGEYEVPITLELDPALTIIGARVT